MGAERAGAIVGLCIVAAPSRDDDTVGRFAEIVALHGSRDAWRSSVGTAQLLFVDTRG